MRRHNGVWAMGIVLALAISGLVSCSKLTGGGDSGDDGNSPFVIVDLRVAAVTDSTIQLKWTATGDDSSAGTANHYDIRYMQHLVNWANWDSATQVVGEPAPSPAGRTDSMTVTGLMKDSTYYFAIMAYDEAGNGSGMSPCTHGTCFMDTVITFPDRKLAAWIRGLFEICDTCDILRSKLMELSFLGDNNDSIAVMDGIEFCTNLNTIYLNGNLISDLTPISGLSRLRDIQFVSNQISDFSPLSNLVNLEAVTFNQNSISDISALGSLILISKLDLSDNDISSASGGIEALRNLFNIHVLYLRNNQITDIHPLIMNTGMGARDTVDLRGNPPFSQAAIADSIALVADSVTVLH